MQFECHQRSVLIEEFVRPGHGTRGHLGCVPFTERGERSPDGGPPIAADSTILVVGFARQNKFGGNLATARVQDGVGGWHDLTHRVFVTHTGGGDSYTEMWSYQGPLPTGAVNVEIDITSGVGAGWSAQSWSADGAGLGTVVDTATFTTAGGTLEITLDSGTKAGMAFVVGYHVNPGGMALRGDMTLDGTKDLGASDGSQYSHETDGTTTGSRLVGHTGILNGSIIGIMIDDGLVGASPGPVGMVLGLTGGTAAPSADLDFIQDTRPGMELGINAPLVTVQGPRQVSLVGGDPETPEMTEGGTEGQVITRHAVPPTWEDGGASLTVKEADGNPTVPLVDTIVVDDGSLTDDGSGQVTLDNTGPTGATGATGPAASPGLAVYLYENFK